MALFFGAEIHLNKKKDQDCNVPLHPTVLLTKHTAVVFPNIILHPTLLQTKHTSVVFPNIILNLTVLQTKHTAVVFLNITLNPTVQQKKHTVLLLHHTALSIHHSVHFHINITELKHVSTLSCSNIRHQSTAKYELGFVKFQIPVPIIQIFSHDRNNT
jgi:hypothetical protein